MWHTVSNQPNLDAGDEDISSDEGMDKDPPYWQLNIQGVLINKAVRYCCIRVSSRQMCNANVVLVENET